MYNREKKALHRVITIFFTIAMCISVLGVQAYAATEAQLGANNVNSGIGSVNLGTDNVNFPNDVINYDLTGSVSFSSNSTTSIEFDSLCLYIENHGVLDITDAYFETYDGNYTKRVVYAGKISPAVATGSSARVEVDWPSMCRSWGYNDAVFPKNNSDPIHSEPFAYSILSAGYTSLGGWHVWWRPSSFDEYFYY